MTKLPVVDDTTRDAMVLGFARTERGAHRVAMRWAADHQIEGVIGVERCDSIQVTFDPDINTRAQAVRANRAGRGWVMRAAEIAVR